MRYGGAARRVAAALLIACATAVGASSSGDELLRLQVRRGNEAALPLAKVVAGGPVVVAFWASWCPPCRSEVPVLKHAAKRWRIRKVRVIGVGVGFEQPSEVADARRAWDIDYETLWVPADQQAALERLLPDGLPATFVVADGTVRRHDRLLSEAELDRLLGETLKVDPPAE